MKIEVQHLQKRGKAGWRYRRKVPAHLRPTIAKLEILIPLGRTEAEALKAYPKVHAGVERMFKEAATKPRIPTDPFPQMTELERFRWATRELGPVDDDDRSIVADAIEAKYRLYADVDEDGAPISYRAPLSDRDAALVQVLMRPDAQPTPTLEDAKRLYLKEKVKGDRKKQLELERIFRLVGGAVELSRPLDSLRREEAKETRDYMFDGGRTAATVDRYLNVVRATINHAIKEYDLSCKNPFMGLEVGDKDKAEPDVRKRRPFTDEEVEKIGQRMNAHAGDTLSRIWRLLAGTGCRLAEIAGLRVADVHLNHGIPHIEVEWHDDRRVKNKSSRRMVPLIGDALEAAKEAVEAAGNEAALFPVYCRKGGPDAASAAIGKHVEATIGKGQKIGPTHSLRHRMADKLDLAGVPDGLRDRLLGHTKGAAREGYGGGLEAWLQMSSAALEKALGSVGRVA